MSNLRASGAASPHVQRSPQAESAPRATPLARVERATAFRDVLRGSASANAKPSAGPSLLREFAERVAQGERAMDTAIRRSQGGQPLNYSELIALQTGVYRYTQELELGSRLVDRATGAIKQVLQSQT